MSKFEFNDLSSKEWLESNGLGGWASSSVSGALTRRYHGLLVAAPHSPSQRIVMLSKLDETLISEGKRFELGTNQYPGLVHPRGFEFLQSYTRELFPVFEYQCNTFGLKKSIAALHGENTTLICYELLKASAPIQLELRPFLAPRNYHELSHLNGSLRWNYQFNKDLLTLNPYDGIPTLFLHVPQSEFQSDPHWYGSLQYEREQERGLDFEEDLFSYGNFRVTLRPGQPLYLIASLQDPSARNGALLLQNETERREQLLKDKNLKTSFSRRLAQAADQFLVRRGESSSTIIAGYPWFTDWGRDTMIALRGLCLSLGRLDLAKEIIGTFLPYLSQGMLPNRFPDGNENPEYNSVDATLWLFVAVYETWKKSGDKDFVLGRCLPALLDVLNWHRKGTRYGIKVDKDGLLKAGDEKSQLTWMDAKVGDWVVTPRHGKAVEINALWINALCISAELCSAAGDPAQAQALQAEAAASKIAFEKAFWNPKTGSCFDVIQDSGADASLRPNQIFCLSLPFPLFENEKALQILSLLEAKLLTPRGLRSLSPDDSRYVPRYQGGVQQRDGSYHQGTVWSWLLGPYAEALIRFRGELGKTQVRELLKNFEPHLEEAGLGTVSEIFDGDAPHGPRGCIAQAWSVAELLRIQIDFLS
jgi:predicted glycogen debranching enzyme